MTDLGRTKRALNLAVGVPLAILTLPVQAATALAIRWRLGSPVLFRQTRAGLHGRPFELVKFRTMTEVDASVGRVDDASRLTPLGRLLRSASLDELPTLWNVIRGDMSLVGPRPLLIDYLGRYDEEQARRHDVRPGLTGPAQVSGRNALPWEERFRLDVAYVDQHSLATDVVILLRTFGTVLRRSGVSAAGHVTMSTFTGTPSNVQRPACATPPSPGGPA